MGIPEIPVASREDDASADGVEKAPGGAREALLRLYGVDLKAPAASQIDKFMGLASGKFPTTRKSLQQSIYLLQAAAAANKGELPAPGWKVAAMMEKLRKLDPSLPASPLPPPMRPRPHTQYRGPVVATSSASLGRAGRERARSAELMEFERVFHELLAPTQAASKAFVDAIEKFIRAKIDENHNLRDRIAELEGELESNRRRQD